MSSSRYSLNAVVICGLDIQTSVFLKRSNRNSGAKRHQDKKVERSPVKLRSWPQPLWPPWREAFGCRWRFFLDGTSKCPNWVRLYQHMKVSFSTRKKRASKKIQKWWKSAKRGGNAIFLKLQAGNQIIDSVKARISAGEYPKKWRVER